MYPNITKLVHQGFKSYAMVFIRDKIKKTHRYNTIILFQCIFLYASCSRLYIVVRFQHFTGWYSCLAGVQVGTIGVPEVQPLQIVKIVSLQCALTALFSLCSSSCVFLYVYFRRLVSPWVLLYEQQQVISDTE